MLIQGRLLKLLLKLFFLFLYLNLLLKSIYNLGLEFYGKVYLSEILEVGYAFNLIVKNSIIDYFILQNFIKEHASDKMKN